jgi:hypothetical protein
MLVSWDLTILGGLLIAWLAVFLLRQRRDIIFRRKR